MNEEIQLHLLASLKFSSQQVANLFTPTTFPPFVGIDGSQNQEWLI